MTRPEVPLLEVSMLDVLDDRRLTAVRRVTFTVRAAKTSASRASTGTDSTR